MKLTKLKVELSKQCTLACVHCSAFANPYNKISLPYSRVEHLLYEFAELQGEEVTFSGGEPFIYAGLPALIQTASVLGLRTVAFSSGVVKSEPNFVSLSSSFFSNYPVLPTKIVFSVYSASANEHELITAEPNSFYLTTTSIKQCVDLGIAVDLHYVPTKQNIRSFPSLVRLAENFHCDTIRILRYVPHGRGKLNKDHLQPDAKDMQEFVSMVTRLQEDTCVNLKLGSAFGFMASGLTSECAAGVDELVIDAKGFVYPCSAFVNVSIGGQHGNILDSTLEDIWKYSDYLAQVRRVLDHRKQCTSKTGCHPGCIAQKTISLGYIADHIMDPDQANV